MFQSFEGAPRICRLYGIGKYPALELGSFLFNFFADGVGRGCLIGTWHERGSPEYEKMLPEEERLAGSRSVIVVKVHKVGSVSVSLLCS